MLVLSRNEGEFIVLMDRETGGLIGSICMIRGDRGRIGLCFPNNVAVIRAEHVHHEDEVDPLPIKDMPPGHILQIKPREQ